MRGPIALSALVFSLSMPAVVRAGEASPRIELEDAGRPLETGAHLRGRVKGLGRGRYVLLWRDAHGVLDRRELEGPGDRAFEFTLSYPRERANVLGLIDPAVPRSVYAAWKPFRIELPPAGRKGFLRVLVPDGRDVPEDFPAEAVLWNVVRDPDPPETGKDLVIDLAIETLGGPPPLEAWARRVVLEGAPSREARVRVPCLNDPAFRDAVKAHMGKALSRPEAKSAAAISLGNGLSATYAGAPYDFCTSPHCEREFREFLRARYKDLGALSKAWGGNFARWEEVSPRSPEEDGFGLGSERHTAWSDHLAFRDRTFARFLRRAAAETRRRVRGVPVGLFGLGRPAAYGGADFEMLGGALDWRGAGWEPGARRLSSAFLPAGRALAAGPGLSASRALAGSLSGELLLLFTPDEREQARAVGLMARGLGRLAALSRFPAPCSRQAEGADFATPRVALVWSQESVRASFLEDSRALGLPWCPNPLGGTSSLVAGRPSSWGRAWEAWCAALSDLGVPFACVSARDVARGDLVSRGFRAAVLVRCLAVGPEEVRALEAFARSGGVVIADAGAGMYDRALARAGPGMLSRLFGVDHGRVRFSETGRRRVAIADRPLRRLPVRRQTGVGPPHGAPTRAGWFPWPRELGIGPAQSGLGLAGARAEGTFGRVPCLIVNAFGGGWGVFLNLAITAYPELRASGRGAGVREVLRGTLARAGVRPAVELRYPEGLRMPPAAELRRAGKVGLLLVRRNEPPRRRPTAPTGRAGTGPSGGRPRAPERRQRSARVKVALATDDVPAAYDPEDGIFLGWTRNLEIDLAPGESKVRTFLPYRLRTILVEPLGRPAAAAPDVPAARPGPELFRVRLRKEGEGAFEFHVLELEVSGPDRRRRGELCGLVEVSGGGTEFTVPFAASDASGLWTVRLRDAATGVTALRRFVRAR